MKYDKGGCRDESSIVGADVADVAEEDDENGAVASWWRTGL